MSGAIDRAEWRRFVAELLHEMEGSPKRNKEPLARKLGVSVKQVSRWLDPEWDGTVLEASVRQVAEASGRNIAQLFERLGYLRQADLPYPPEDRWIVDVINASNLSDQGKRAMIATQLAQAAREREEHRRRLAEQIDMVVSEAEPRRTKKSSAKPDASVKIDS